MTCPDENQLVLLGEGVLDEPARRPLEAHLDACASCDAVVRELAALVDSGPSVPARYRLLGRLGSGGMGVVWAAEDRELRRKVALKVVRGDRAFDARLVREARLIAGVSHPNVITVYDVGVHADQLYIAMELVAGTNARVWRADQTRDEILGVWIAAARGLIALQRAGIVHRDVKPENVLVDRDRVVVCDLGLALDPHATTLTATGLVVGTPAYMAPEQLRGDSVDARADQYAWCVATLEALGDQADARTRRVLERGLARSPDERWPDLEALLASLAIPPRRRLGLIAIAGCVAITAAVLVTHTGAKEAPVVARVVPPEADATVAAPVVVPAAVDAAVRVRARDAATVDASALPALDSYPQYNEIAQRVGAAEAEIMARDPHCARVLAALPPVTPVLGTMIADRIAIAHPRCEMVTDCVAGKAHLVARMRAQRSSAEAIAAALVDADTQLCPIAAPGTPAEREGRVRFRLLMANASAEPCVAIVDAAEAAQIAPPLFAIHAAKCLARAGQCERARRYDEHVECK